MAVDTPANAIRVEVDKDALAISEELASEISNELGVSIFVWVGQPVQTLPVPIEIIVPPL